MKTLSPLKPLMPLICRRLVRMWRTRSIISILNHLTLAIFLYMSCVLTIAGKNLDVDDFIAKNGLTGFVKRDNQKVANSISNLGKDFSFVSATVSEGALDYFERQVAGAIEYLLSQ